MELSICSASSAREVVFSNRDGEFFTVDLIGSPSATMRVSTYTDDLGLNNLFIKLGRMNKPWSKPLRWESLEGEFSISASCSSTGVVLFDFALLDLPGHPEESRLTFGLETEFGQLSELATESNSFFSAGNT